MKWNKTSLQQYVQAKEYVDTILMPLLPFHFSYDSDLEKASFQGEALTVFLDEIEKELTGRVMLTPSYNYLKFSDKKKEVDRINEWVADASTQPFKEIFFVTFDSKWKQVEKSLDGTLLWLPGIKSGDLYSKEMYAVIRDQVEQVSELIRSYWQEF